MAEIFINADTGNDTTGNGSSGSPYLTLNKAVTVSATGDTITCQNSTATYTITDGMNMSGKNLTIRGQKDDATGAIFDGAGGNRRWISNTNGNTFAISKITLRNFVAYDNGAFLRLPTTAGATGTFTFTNCKFHDIQSDASQPTSVICDQPSNWDVSWTVTYTNCLFYDITRTATTSINFLFGTWGSFSGSGGITLVGCTVILDGTSTTNLGKIFGQNPLSCKNSIFYNNSGETIALGATTGFTYCDFNGFSDSQSGTGNITSDPLFVDVANSNFNLRPTSPCIDTGVLV